jgi:ABC-type transporter Mla subunit MlaD
MEPLATSPTAIAESRRAEALFRAHQQNTFRRTDYLFAALLACEWLASIGVALWVSPRTWAGLSSTTHPHVWAAIVLGGAIVSLPILLALALPGHTLTRHVIAVGQMLYAALLIHLTGGRIETHFLIFGSLAFLAFYRDWRVLISATIVVAGDHFLREAYWPESLYGVAATSGWRWVEHAWWVVFENAFLIMACREGVREMRALAERQARVERDHLATTVDRIGAAALWVGTASQQFIAAATRLSAGSQAQAAALEETAASLEEVTSAVTHNAENAQQANQLAATAREVAQKGGQVVGSAVTAMGEINQASRKIVDIITAIDEIAFQTNLLALNAAVEAARAGEQGRGFAVVAAEVRNLAQRSAAAAKEIKGLIQDSVRKVETGSDLVNKSGQALEEIVASVRRVTDLMAEIAATSKEQATGINQVNRAVAQMDGVVQQNATQAEELTSTAQSLIEQAEELTSLVGQAQQSTDRTAGTKGPGEQSQIWSAPLRRLSGDPHPRQPARARDHDKAPLEHASSAATSRGREKVSPGSRPDIGARNGSASGKGDFEEH